MKFKQGDRVRLAKPDYIDRINGLQQNAIGILAEDDDGAPCVAWEGYTRGSAAFDLGGFPKERLRPVFTYQIELAEPLLPTKTPVAQVTRTAADYNSPDTWDEQLKQLASLSK